MSTLIPKFDLKDGGATPTGAVNRAINLKLQETISVKDFGAVGNGTTDDTVAIQNAFNAVSTNGPTRVIFPKGTYLITDTVLIKSNTVVDGQFNTIKIKDQNASLRISEASNVLVENLIINGNSTNYTSSGSNNYPFYSVSSSDVTIRKCTMYNMEYAGFGFNQGGTSYNKRGLVENCHIYDVGNAGKAWSYGNGVAVTGGEDIIIRDNVIHNILTVSGIDLEGTLQNNIIISGNRIYDCSGASFVAINLTQGSAPETTPTNVIIKDNIISGITGGLAIWVFSGDNVVVANNLVSDCNNGNIAVTYSNNILIDGNSIRNCVKGGFQTDSARYCKIVNNHLECPSGVLESHAQNQYFIIAYSVLPASMIISNNTAINCPAEAFILQDRTPAQLTNNTIINCRSDAGSGKGYGINYGPPSAYGTSIIGNNIIIDTIGNYGTRFYGFYNFQGGVATDTLYLADNWNTVSNGMPKFDIYAATGQIKSTSAILSAAPTAGYGTQGDVVWNGAATVGQPTGWVCTVAGTPGTWVALANL